MDNTENQPQETAPSATPTQPVQPAVDVKQEQKPPEQTPEPKADGEDFSWVPPKFIREGKPDFQTLAESYQALEKKIETKGSFAPESVDEYDYTPSKITLDEEANKQFKEEALKAGLSPSQYKWALEQYEKAYEQTAETPEKAKAYLEKQWGKDFDKQMKNAVRAFQTYVPSHISMDSIGNNPVMIDILAHIGAELVEDTAPAKITAKAPGATKEDIQKIMSDPRYYKDTKLQKQVAEWYKKNAK